MSSIGDAQPAQGNAKSDHLSQSPSHRHQSLAPARPQQATAASSGPPEIASQDHVNHHAPNPPGPVSVSVAGSGSRSGPAAPGGDHGGGGVVDDDNDDDDDDDDAASAYEQEHVHSVYESIASHFSATRYKPWPVIASFLTSLPPGSVGLDVGCGNGKYLAVNPDVHIVGSDRSPNLVRIARDHGGGERRCDVAVADGLSLPFPDARADFAICVAVIHHMSTRQRRREAVRALLDAVRPGTGRVLVYVWALEQANSRRGWDAGASQDQMVPWVFRSKTKPADGGTGDITYQRYYHLYKKGEVEEDVVAVGGKVIDSGYDKDNWWAIASRDQ